MRPNLLDVGGDCLDGPVGGPLAVGLPDHDGDGDGAVRVVERLAQIAVEDRVEAEHLQLAREECPVHRVLRPRPALRRRAPVEVQLLELVPAAKRVRSCRRVISSHRKTKHACRYCTAASCLCWPVNC